MFDTSPQETAIVVGATGAFGQAIVQKLCDHGLQVLAVARTASALAQLQQQYPQIQICVADIAHDSAIDAIQEQLTQPVRLIVHGPGVGVAGSILTASTQLLVDAVNIKVGGLLRVTRAADSHLQAGSRIVAIGGHYGLEPTAYASSAGVANAALVNVVRQLSLAYGSRGITAHVIAPGPADTERLRQVAVNRAQLQGISPEDVLAAMQTESSLGQFTTPAQVAWAVSLFLAEEATAMTGSTLMLDAGRRRGLP